MKLFKKKDENDNSNDTNLYLATGFLSNYQTPVQSKCTTSTFINSSNSKFLANKKIYF